VLPRGPRTGERTAQPSLHAIREGLTENPPRRQSCAPSRSKIWGYPDATLAESLPFRFDFEIALTI